MTEPTKLLSVTRVAAQLSCSRGHVYNLIATGELGEVVDIATPGAGRSKTRLYPAAVDAFIKRRSRST